jgi:Pentapeptide repeats (8 copies)
VLALAGSIAIVGQLTQHYGLDEGPALWAIHADVYAYAAAELASVALAVLVIDGLNARRADEQLKAQLIRELGSRDNPVALRAVRELRAHGWLQNGLLRGASLYKANLAGAALHETDLQRAKLAKANLAGAFLVDADLRSAKLEGAIVAGADLRGANLRQADLRGAILEGAILQETDMQGAILDGSTPPNGLMCDDRRKDRPAYAQ